MIVGKVGDLYETNNYADHDNPHSSTFIGQKEISKMVNNLEANFWTSQNKIIA